MQLSDDPKKRPLLTPEQLRVISWGLVRPKTGTRLPRLMLPGQSEMNGPIVDSEASLNPTYDVSAYCAVSAHPEWVA
jgi:hypothetical protein